MRIYLPATVRDLDPTRLAAPTLRRVHAVTAALRQALPEEDLEGLELAAQLAAADDSLDLLVADLQAPAARCVITAEVPDAAVHKLDAVHDLEDDDDAALSMVELRGGVRWDQVQCAHVDEPAAAQDLLAARRGDQAAWARAEDHDLLWYDVTELADLAASHS